MELAVQRGEKTHQGCLRGVEGHGGQGDGWEGLWCPGEGRVDWAGAGASSQHCPCSATVLVKGGQEQGSPRARAEEGTEASQPRGLASASLWTVPCSCACGQALVGRHDRLLATLGAGLSSCLSVLPLHSGTPSPHPGVFLGPPAHPGANWHQVSDPHVILGGLLPSLSLTVLLPTVPLKGPPCCPCLCPPGLPVAVQC